MTRICTSAPAPCRLQVQGRPPGPSQTTLAPTLPNMPPQYPQLDQLGGSFVLSLNQEYLAPGEDAALAAGDEVAVIPPISGG